MYTVETMVNSRNCALVIDLQLTDTEPSLVVSKRSMLPVATALMTAFIYDL